MSGTSTLVGVIGFVRYMENTNVCRDHRDGTYSCGYLFTRAGLYQAEVNNRVGVS